MSYLSETSAEQIILERLRVGASHRVSNYILQNMEVRQWVDNLSDSIAYQFRSDVLARTLGTDRATVPVCFEHPASTWQMFKHSHRDGRWLGWMARRWPVRMTEVAKYATFETKERVAFPDATIRFPKELGNPIYFQTVEVLR